MKRDPKYHVEYLLAEADIACLVAIKKDLESVTTFESREDKSANLEKLRLLEKLLLPALKSYSEGIS